MPDLSTLPPAMFVYYTQILFHLIQMKLYHEKVYLVTQQLAQQLADTSLNVDCRFLKSPYHEIYIQIDRGLFQIIDMATMKPVDVDGIYVFIDDRNGKREIRIMSAAMLKSTPEYTFNDSVFYFRFFMDEGMKVMDVVKKYLDDPDVWNGSDVKKLGGEINKAYIETLSSFVFNTLLYITSKNADIQAQLPVRAMGLKKGRKKQSKEQKRSERTSVLPYILVGGNVKRDENYEKVSLGGISKWKLDKRVYVEGYWRVQWYGSEKESTRHSEVIWIQPYYKGPELADMLKNQHKVV
jgi:hypothetical protein